MARDRAARDSRYLYAGYSDDDRDRDRRHHRRHRHRDEYDWDYDAAKRERRERRRAEEARREAALDIDELRARRESYYTRPEADRRRDSQRMAQEIRVEREKDKPRRSSQRDVRRDATVRRNKKRAPVEDDRSDDYVYGRPQPRPVVEEVTVRRSSGRRRSDEGGSSSRTEHTPLSGSRSASVRREGPPTLSRSMSAREPQRVYMTRPSVRRTSTIKLPAATARPAPRPHTSSARDARRGSGLLATLFGPPPRPHTAVLAKEIPRVECIICMDDDLPANKTAKLGCGHRMCHACLKRQFTLSVSDPKHMPPTCCSAHIPLKYAERLFDDKFKRLWNKKYQEYTTANRLYCPSKGCGEWIKPSKIRVDLTNGRKYARCGRCNTKVCVLCNNRFHTRRECPRDEETNRLVEMAKEKGWQRCFNCRAVVELKEGCNHMTCRCAAQFCMVCAAPWKTCSCPWFSYSNLDDGDRLNDMRVPYAPHDMVEVIDMPSQPEPVPIRRSSTRARRRPDRDLDRADEVLAAHLQSQLRMEPTPTASEVHRADPAVGVYGLGNSGRHHMNDSYAVRPLATSTGRTAARIPAPRSFFSRRTRLREPPREVPRPQLVRTATAAAMAGLSRDGSKHGANRVGTWLNHVEVDDEAIRTAPRDVEVDDWRIDGSVRGID